MNRLEPVTFRERVAEFEAAVAACPEVAEFCSGPDWQLAAHDSLHGRDDSGNFLFAESDDAWLAFREDSPSVFFPLESAWCFGCPLIGDPDATIRMLRTVVREDHPGGAGFLITGVRKGGALHSKLAPLENEAIRYSEFPTTDCMTADLSEGVDPWLMRRSRKFRRTIRNLAFPEEIAVENASTTEPDSLFRRMLAVQEKTYKWTTGTDIFQGEEYRAFYRDLLGRLSGKGTARIQFARQDDEDLAYIFGGISGTVYRGLQMSYIEEVKKLGLGNFLQIDNMRRVAKEGITHYDLGMHSEYKERWADDREEYVGIFIVLAGG